MFSTRGTVGIGLVCSVGRRRPWTPPCDGAGPSSSGANATVPYSIGATLEKPSLPARAYPMPIMPSHFLDWGPVDTAYRARGEGNCQWIARDKMMAAVACTG